MMNYRVTHFQQLALLLAGAAMLAACGGLASISADMPPTTEQSEPQEVVNAFHAAINSGDIEITLALFAEDALVTDRGAMSEGMEQIRDWIEYLHMPAALHLEMIESEVDGEKVSWSDVADNEPGSGYGPYILRWKAVIEKGKIKSIVVAPLPIPDGK